ncbi:MAG: hypothetical protein HYZ01_01675 [Ignavibacteriales bacterium]|nr:hypothetical protein [Ignavibacteriales bacterium]
MPLSSSRLESLRPHLLALLNNSYTQKDLEELVRVAHAFAMSLLRSKILAGRLNPGFFGLSLQDLAYDSIGDLFQRNEKGVIVQIVAYFDGISFNKCTDQMLTAHFRRLVFSKVHENLFRAYNTVDPSLGKIIRSLKLCIHSIGHFVELTRFGQPYIAPSHCDILKDRPLADARQLGEWLRRNMRRTDRIPQILSRLSLLLRDQEDHARMVPLVDLAFVIRSLFQEDRWIEAHHSDMESRLHMEDIRQLVHVAGSQIMKQTRPEYVGKKKLSASLFSLYFLGIERRIGAELVDTDGEGKSLFDDLKIEIPDLSRHEYVKKHKNILEYLHRLVYERALELIRKG